MRNHDRSIEINATPERIFAALVTPSDIRKWWNAARAIVLAMQGGLWVAAWGEEEDWPDYITSASIRLYEPPRHISLSRYNYYAKSGRLPFEADFMTDFIVDASSRGGIVRVVQDGFPDGKEADEFYAGCGRGWNETLANIKKYLEDEGRE